MTDGAELAVLFLDVDGTLIPFGRRPGRGASAAVTAGREASDAANPLLSRLDAEDGPRLLALGCDLVWATSWMDEANEEISPRLGLPTLPVVAWSDGIDDVETGRLHWKTKELVAWAAGRSFVWVDDEITDADRTWVAARHPGDALLHRVEAGVGLIDADFAAIRRWLDLRGRLVVPIRELTQLVQRLLDDLCVDLGICLPPADQDRLRLEPPLNVDAFVDTVFLAEGLDPNLNSRLRRQALDKIAIQMPDIMSAYRTDGL